MWSSWFVSKVCYPVSTVELKELLWHLVIKLNLSILLFSCLRRKRGKVLLVEEWLRLSMDGWWVRIFTILQLLCFVIYLFCLLLCLQLFVSLNVSKDGRLVCNWLVYLLKIYPRIPVVKIIWHCVHRYNFNVSSVFLATSLHLLIFRPPLGR